MSDDGYKFEEPDNCWERFISGKPDEERNRAIRDEAYRRLEGLNDGPTLG